MGRKLKILAIISIVEVVINIPMAYYYPTGIYAPHASILIHTATVGGIWGIYGLYKLIATVRRLNIQSKEKR